MAPGRLRIAAIVTAFAVLLGAGVFWLVRLIVDDSSPEWQSSAADAVPAASAPGSATDPAAAVPTISAAPLGSSAPAPTGTVEGGAPPVAGQTTTTPGTTTQTKPQPPPPPVSIQLGGVTLDNTNPDFSCTSFRNEDFAVPVTVTGIVLSDRNPSGNALGIEANHCAQHNEASRACVSGVVLRPNADGCYIGVETSGQEPSELSTAKVHLSLVATCTSRSGEPCSRLPARFTPSPGAPVRVTWTDAGRALCSFPGIQPDKCSPDTADIPS